MIAKMAYYRLLEHMIDLRALYVNNIKGAEYLNFCSLFLSVTLSVFINRFHYRFAQSVPVRVLPMGSMVAFSMYAFIGLSPPPKGIDKVGAKR